MRNFDDIIHDALADTIASMTDTEIRNLVETYLLEHGDEVVSRMIADRVRKTVESVLFDLPF